MVQCVSCPNDEGNVLMELVEEVENPSSRHYVVIQHKDLAQRDVVRSTRLKSSCFPLTLCPISQLEYHYGNDCTGVMENLEKERLDKEAARASALIQAEKAGHTVVNGVIAKKGFRGFQKA